MQLYTLIFFLNKFQIKKNLDSQNFISKNYKSVTYVPLPFVKNVTLLYTNMRDLVSCNKNL
jgi:hypothetical protein